MRKMLKRFKPRRPSGRFTRVSAVFLTMALSLAMLMSGCNPLKIERLDDATATEAKIQTSTPAPTLTASVVWFPPTSTPLPLFTPTAVPTEDRLSDLGAELLRDAFSAKTGWQTARKTEGNITLSDTGTLTFSLPGYDASLTSYASKMAFYQDYYLSVEVTLSFCSYHEDAYGLLFRVIDSDNYARLWINCMGQTRIERRIGGKLTPLNDWTANGKIRPGAPQKFTLGLRADGSMIELYLNGTYQSEIEDPAPESGSVGFAARTSGMTPLTVSFSNLSLRRLNR